MRHPVLRGGHHLQLLEGSVQLFPAMVAAIDAAQQEVLLETYIFDFTGSSTEVAYALERAARRGVTVRVLVDGVGCGNAPDASQHRLKLAGVDWRVYSPPGPFGLLSPNQWRRLHRKLCVVDGTFGFCGGINVLDDFHDPNHGKLDAPRLDFSVSVTGPLVVQMRDAMMRLWLRLETTRLLRQAELSGALESLRALRRFNPPFSPSLMPQPGQAARAALLLRDNFRSRVEIEAAYRRAIGRAQQEIIIANAYFVPGRKMRNALVQAATRGVRVSLLLQGRYEYFMQYYASRPVVDALLAAGVEIYEYAPSFLHAKVAVIDGQWATVGSSNLDPLSLLLAREANIAVEDEPFAQRLRQRLLHAMQHEGRRIDAQEHGKRPMSQRAKEWVAMGIMRVALLINRKTYL